MEVGTFQILEAYKETQNGMFLRDKDQDEVLLPAKYVPTDLKEGDQIEVFIYLDSQEREIATTQKPKINPYEFAFLTCVDEAPFGAFMDWGLDRDLLIPTFEQETPILKGKSYLVYLFMDERDRPTGTTFIERCVSNEDFDLEVGTEVDLLVYKFTDMGMKVIINQTYDGLLYRDQVQKRLIHSEEIKGYISKIRPGNKIDVSLHRFGYRKVEDNAQKILDALKAADGFLPLNDKTDPEIINKNLHISKKVFKKAIGALYKEKLIKIEKDGIYLVK